MAGSRTLQRAVGVAILAFVVGFYWLIAKVCDLASPQVKWFVIPAGLAIGAFALVRSFARDVKKYVEATKAYARRDIEASALPLSFRFITHKTTLQEVTAQLGPASRVIDLALRHRDGDTEHFKAYEYDLPYNAAVIVMPQRPFEPEDKIRAVYMRTAPADDWLTVES